jgi:hypothetical protein
MDIETSEAIESVRGDIRRVEATLGSEIGKLRSEMSAMRDELRHHMDIRFESVRDDIRILAEGYASLAAGQAAISAKLDRLLPPPA